jgi:crotonobetainyl-CoA:carnitine CoA-transferase CaiB-like acyl-CoA transferase
MGANFMALAVMGALVRRNRTGQGASIDMSCTDAGLALAGPELLDFTVNGRPTRKSGSVNSNADNLPTMAPHGIYPAADADTWVAIACRDDDDWTRLTEVISEDWTAEPRFRRLDGRLAERDGLDKRVAAWTAQRPADDVRDAVRRAGVPCAKVASPPDRVDHDQATTRWGLWPTVRHTVIGDVRVDGMPMHLSETDWVIARGAPCLGEHNRFVFGELLGLSDAELERHVAAGVI